MVDASRDDYDWTGHITSIQTSKRTDDKDWVYRSNPQNSSYFRAEENGS